MNLEGESMFELEKDTKKIFTIPNIISFVRILLIVPFVIFYINGDYLLAGVILAVSGLSDMFDGMIARKFNQITDLGKVLDPIADKLTLILVIICLGTTVPQIIPLVAVLILKEVLMLLGGANLVKKRIKPPSAKWYGKVATVVFYISMVTIVMLEIFNTRNLYTDITTTVLMFLTAVSMVFAIVQYGRIYFKLLKENKNKNNK